MSVTLSELPLEVLSQIVTECDDLTIVILYCTSVLLRKAVTTIGKRLLPKHNKCYKAAARDGHLNVLKWLKENKCEWDCYTCSRVAARGGHLDVLKWFRENGPEWDGDTCRAAAGEVI